MVLCTGCNHEFSASGYTKHVNLTTTAVCRAAFHNPSVPYDDNDVDMEDTDSESFAGDFYGHYEQADFGWPEDDDGMKLHYLRKSKCLQ